MLNKLGPNSPHLVLILGSVGPRWDPLLGEDRAYVQQLAGF